MTLEPAASPHTQQPGDTGSPPPPGSVNPEEPKTRWQRIRGLLAIIAGLAAGVLLLRQVDPHEPGIYPICPTKVLTGLDCPGCGGLRATNELAHGDIAAAFDDNALVVLAVPFVGWLLARAFYFAWTGRTPDPMPPRRARWLTIAAIVVLTVFTVVRNLPGSFLASG